MKRLFLYISLFFLWFANGQSLLKSIISQSAQDNFDRSYQTLYLDTQGDGGERKALDPFYTYSVGKNPVDNNYYIAMMMDGGSPNNRATKIFKYDNDLILLDSFVIPNDPSITSTFDSHLKPVIGFDQSGHLFVSREKGADASNLIGGHNTDQFLYKTNVMGDLSTLSLINTNTGYWSYQVLWVNTNGIYVGSRGNALAEELDAFNIAISTDGGVNFNNYEVFETGLNGGGRAYCQIIHNYDNDDIIIGHNRRSSVTSSFVALYILKSSDGINWQNFQGTFTKNVSSSTSITQAELDANCLVWEGATEDDCINFEGGNYKNGKLRALVTRSLRDGNVSGGNAYQTYKEARLYTYDSGWTYTDVTDLLFPYYGVWALERTFQLAWDGIYDYIISIDKSETVEKVYESKSIDLFRTYTTSLSYEREANLYIGSHSFNADTNADRLIIITDVGDLNDLNSSSNIAIVKPE